MDRICCRRSTESVRGHGCSWSTIRLNGFSLFESSQRRCVDRTHRASARLPSIMAPGAHRVQFWIVLGNANRAFTRMKLFTSFRDTITWLRENSLNRMQWIISFPFSILFIQLLNSNVPSAYLIYHKYIYKYILLIVKNAQQREEKSIINRHKHTYITTLMHTHTHTYISSVEFLPLLTIVRRCLRSETDRKKNYQCVQITWKGIQSDEQKCVLIFWFVEKK